VVEKTSSLETIGTVTIMGCPTCMTPLYEVTEADESRFCCSNGHSFSLDDICPGIEESLGGLLGTAIEAVLKR